MTVKELIEKLAGFPQDAIIMIDEPDENWIDPIQDVKLEELAQVEYPKASGIIWWHHKDDMRLRNKTDVTFVQVALVIP